MTTPDPRRDGPVGRVLRARFGDGIRLVPVTLQEWNQIESGWPERIAPAPFHVEQEAMS